MEERLADKNPCNSCKADRQIGNPNRWECECDNCDKPIDWKNDCIKKLAEYETAEEEGRIKKFPIALGSTVYELQKIRKRIQPYIITGASVALNNSGYFFSWKLKDGKGIYGNINGFSDSRIGKTVFLTMEEAEKALKEMEGK